MTSTNPDLVNTKKHPHLRRVDGTTDPSAALKAVSGNILGNLPWLMELAVHHAPPPNMMGMPVGHFVSIDDMGIYGEALWILHKRVLGMDIAAFSALSDALQARTVGAVEIREAVRAHLEGPRDKADALSQAMLTKAGVTVRTEAQREADYLATASAPGGGPGR